MLLDRWQAEFAPAEPTHSPEVDPVGKHFVPSSSSDKESAYEERNVNFCNYFGIGVDASIAGGFDKLRRRHPGFCLSRFVNKMHYLWLGALELLVRSGARLEDQIKLECDGVMHALGAETQ